MIVTDVWIGPVKTLPLDPQVQWTSSPSAAGMRAFSITAQFGWVAAQQLAELVDNPGRRVTIADRSGVLEYVHFADPMLGPFRGWYVLETFDPGPVDFTSSLEGVTGIVPCTLAGARLSDLTHRQVVVARTARSKDNDFTLAAKSHVANPYWGEDVDGQLFVVPPGGTFVTREYDPSSPHDPAAPVPADGSRQLGLYVGTVTPSSDALAPVVLPDLKAGTDFDGQATPRWVTDRGGDVRAYDRREEREVYGPNHPFRTPTDLLLTNGLCRFWVGNRGLAPFLNVAALADGAWREVGLLKLAADAGPVLRGARLVWLTADEGTVALSLQDQGEVFVTLRRGERMLRIQHGADRTPVTASRVVAWDGLHPASAVTVAANGPALFGKGLAGEGVEADASASWADPVATWADPVFDWGETAGPGPDVKLLWPPEQPITAWAMAFRYRASNDASDSRGVGFLTIYDDAGARAVQLHLDPADGKVKLELGGDVLASTPQVFGAGDDLFVCARFSVTEGAALSVAFAGGPATHVYDASMTDPGTTGRYVDFRFLTDPTDWGDGTWGDGMWGGDLHWLEGVIDNLMIFEDRPTDAEVDALAVATVPLGGLPFPEGRLIWYAPFDARPQPYGSAMATGRVYEISQSTGLRLPDDFGLTKALAVLESGAAASGRFGVSKTAAQLEIAAYLATATANDDLADHQAQFAAESEQEVRVR